MTVNDVCALLGITEYDRIELSGGATVAPQVFAELFATASSVPSYEELMAIDQNRLGYAEFIATLRSKGIIS